MVSTPLMVLTVVSMMLTMLMRLMANVAVIPGHHLRRTSMLDAVWQRLRILDLGRCNLRRSAMKRSNQHTEERPHRTPQDHGQLFKVARLSWVHAFI
jgi:hypothetical protein